MQLISSHLISSESYKQVAFSVVSSLETKIERC